MPYSLKTCKLKFRVFTLLLFGLPAYHSNLFSQATVLGSDAVDGSYYTYDLTDNGIFRQMRFQANVTAGTGTRKWEFCEGTSGTPSYATNWRPYTGPLTISGYNQTIPPVGGTASAVYNTGSGGTGGFLQDVTAGNYYTFNITEYSTPGVPVNEYMGVLETNFAPCDITTVTQTPVTVYDNNSVLITVETATAPSSGENIYLRWSTTLSFLTSTLTQVTMSGTTGTAIIPCQASGTTVYYYVYSSNRTSAAILADVGVNGQVAHDMSTLVLNNNGGPNYQYTVGTATSACGVYSVPSTCFPTVSSFVNYLNGTSVSCSVVCYVDAGHTETAPAGGINLTQTGTAANTISFMKYGSGANPVIYAQTGTVSMTGSSTTIDGIFSLNGSDYITIDGIDLQDNNASAPGTMEYGYALFKASDIDGCQYNTIRNCSITLNRTNSATGPGNFGNGCRGIFAGNLTRSALTTSLTISTTTGRNDYNKFSANTVRNVFSGIIVRGYNDVVAPYTYFDQYNTVGDSGEGNVIENYGGSGSTAVYGIYLIHQNNANIAYNTVNNSASGGTTHTSTLYGIFHSSATSGSLGINVTIKNNIVSLAQGAVGSRLTGIKTGGTSGVSAGTISITANTVENCTFSAGATGDFYAIDQTFDATSNTISDNIIQNNILNTTNTASSYLIYDNNSSTNTSITTNTLTANNKTGTGGSLYGYFNQQGTTAGSSITIENNTIDDLSVLSSSSGTVVGIRLTTSTNQTKTIRDNSISNLNGGTSTTTYTTGITADGLTTGSTLSENDIITVSGGNNTIGILCSGVASLSTGSNVSYDVYDNNIQQISSTSSLGAYGIVLTATSTTSTINCYNNDISNISLSGAGVPTIAGIRTSGGLSSGSFNIYDNSISDISHTATTGSATAVGINCLSTAPVDIYRNNIHTIYGNSSGDQVMGIYYGSGTTTHEVYNNFVQNCFVPNGGSVYGISCVAGTSTYNISYNTIALGYGGILTGGTNLSASGVFYQTTATLVLRNNIIYVNATTAGTGVASCVRRASGTAYTLASNFSSSSNNNYYWINYGSYNYIYVEGTSSSTIVNGWAWSTATVDVVRNLNDDACFNVEGTDNTSYKYFMSSDASSRESGSLYDAIPFVGGSSYPLNLKLTTGSTNYAESHASVLAGISTDWEGDTRSASTPDIGADEGTFVLQDPSCYLLPVELITFTGWYNDALKVNELYWQTATEINTDVFEIEKSSDGVHFEKIGAADAAGNSTTTLSYAFTDDAPYAGDNYYRLKMIDLDASFEYSDIIHIYIQQNFISDIHVFPNPATATLSLSLFSENNQDYNLQITDMAGREVLNNTLSVSDGNNMIQVPVAQLASATYFLQLTDAAGNSYITKFIKAE